MSPVFLIDTSTRYLIFGRLDAEGRGAIRAEVLDMRDEDTIDKAFAGFFPEITDLGAIWLGQGPGSFVGLRSSFAYVRMLSMLSRVPCRTYYSSRLWRALFGVPVSDWFLMRTNAKLYYADRFIPEREGRAVDLAGVAELTGTIFCFKESWQSAGDKIAEPIQAQPPWKELRISDAVLQTANLTPELLDLAPSVGHEELTPLYGHELNFSLART